MPEAPPCVQTHQLQIHIGIIRQKLLEDPRNIAQFEKKKETIKKKNSTKDVNTMIKRIPRST